MGICGSKPSPDVTAASNNNARTAAGTATPSSPPPVPSSNQTVVEKIAGALDALNSRASIMDQIGLAKQMMVDTTHKTKEQVAIKARQLQLIFATPLPAPVDSYVAPVYPKSQQEQDFIRNAILNNFVFSNVHESELRTMVMAFEQVTYDPKDTIIAQGDTGDYFYVIRKGAVQFQIHAQPVGDFASSGQTFGELALLYHAPRAATCVAWSANDDPKTTAATTTKITSSSDNNNNNNNKLILYRVDQTTFRYICQTRNQNTDKMKRKLLRAIPFLKELDDADLRKMADNLTPRTFSQGDVLVKKGDVGDAFYVIQEGRIMVRDIEVGGKEAAEDLVLGPGEYFGERALVMKEPRAANCVAMTSGIALCVDSDTFTRVLGNMQDLILKASEKRLLAALTIFQTTTLDASDYSSMTELIVDKKFPKGHIVFREGHHTTAALYIIREGQVKLTSKSATEYNDKVFNQGGFFGEEMLEYDVRHSVDPQTEPRPKVTYTVTVTEDCTVGILTLEECRTVFDTTKMGQSRRSNLFDSGKDTKIEMESLTRHCILGAGTFGQVWLVSRLASDGKERRAYALKIQSKFELIRHQQAKGVVQEKDIMAQLRHPFIIQLVTTYQDPKCVYMLLGLVQGGELFTQMHKPSGAGIPEADAQFYTAGILEGLGHMHRRHILYRDLKPENVLLDASGYPVIVDLGFAKYVKEKTYTLCGTPLYIAPEVILNRGHDKGADHWSLACMIYEMISGLTPFYKEGMDQLTLFRAIVHGEVHFPKTRKINFSPDCKSLISRMLVVDPTQRLGSLATGEKEIYRDAWFGRINFNELKRKKIAAPWVPKIKDPLDRSNFENWDHLDDKALAKDPPISAADNELFSSF